MSQDFCMHCNAVAISKVIKMLDGMTEISKSPWKIPKWLKFRVDDKMINESGKSAEYIKDYLVNLRSSLVVEARKSMTSQLKLREGHTGEEIDRYVKKFTDEMMGISEDDKDKDHLVEEARKIIKRGNS